MCVCTFFLCVWVSERERVKRGTECEGEGVCVGCSLGVSVGVCMGVGVDVWAARERVNKSKCV